MEITIGECSIFSRRTKYFSSDLLDLMVDEALSFSLYLKKTKRRRNGQTQKDRKKKRDRKKT